jgi:7-cyano-7-deazaguanine synthase
VRTEETAQAVWIPNRNGLLLNVAACYAEGLHARRIVVGFNREEAATFPDNSAEFVAAVNRALTYATRNQVQVVCYTLRLDKTEIVHLGNRLKVPWEYVWSCYHGGDRPCGRCESCRRLQRAFSLAEGEEE